MISIKGLHKFFNKGKQNEIHVINDVSIDLPEKGMTAVFGKSGCGKTTLLNVIGGLDGFSEGSVCIEGRDIRTDTDEIRNRYIGYIFQNYNLNNRESCFDNVAAALRLCGLRDEAEIERRVEIALRNVGMEKYARRTPDTLSGGQQQRIAIARAIVKNPKIILADEPTGNLDDANTVMIMDLLSRIAREHLVILVTHEEGLVDAYCDSIIELSDGRIKSLRKGDADGRIVAGGKQDIYLGELDKKELSTPEISLEYYGEPASEPVNMKIVNKDGRIYLELGSDRIHIIDGTGEVRLVEGVYRDTRDQEDNSRAAMTELPEAVGEKIGSLFTLSSSLKEGFKQSFKGQSKGKKSLRRLLLLFAAVTVLISAVFGNAIGELLTLSESYNHYTFYVYTEDGEVSETLNSAVGGEDSAIDFISLYAYYPSGDENLPFRIVTFETFEPLGRGDTIYANAVILDMAPSSEARLLAGSREQQSDEYILISDKIADTLLENAALGYVDGYDDLIGMTCSSIALDGKSLRVGGVVATGENAIYLSELAMAKFSYSRLGFAEVELAKNYGFALDEGSAVLVISNSESVDFSQIGEKISIRGVDFVISEVIRPYGSYDEWLKDKYSDFPERDEYFEALLPDGQGEAELEEIINEKYFEYDEYKYSRLDEYLSERCILSLEDSFNLWIYFEKQVKEIRSLYYPDELNKAEEYRRINGRYPTREEYLQSESELAGQTIDLSFYHELYENEYYSGGADSFYNNVCLVSDADYIKLSKRVGESDSIFISSDLGKYTVVHSFDPERTGDWLDEKFGHLSYDYYETIISPEEIFSQLSEGRTDSITGYGVALAVILSIMSVAMYFIMRSSLMGRIKEIGIYRAIGVSKRNLIFRFTVESALFTALTVAVGYLFTSAFVYGSIRISPRVAEVFFYPPWYALAVFLLLCAISVLFGILPILLLLRKTPSQILAKYDI